MPSFKSTSLLAAAALVSVAKADYIIDPETVSSSDRASWCQQELASCPLICEQLAPGEPIVNECDPDVLTYGCVCSDGKRPNVSEYTLTLPYFTCMEWGNQCVAKCSGNNECANTCREDNRCGAQDPRPPNKTQSATGTSEPTSSSTSDAEDSINTDVLGDTVGGDQGAAVALGRSYGLAVVAGVLFAGFTML